MTRSAPEELPVYRNTSNNQETRLLIQEFKNIFLLIWDLKFLQQLMIFIPECFFPVMRFLVQHIFHNTINMWLRIGKYNITLPTGRQASCQLNFPLIHFLAVINSLLSTFISFTKSEIRMEGWKPTNKCVWSGMQWMASIFDFRFCTRPVIYLWSCSLFSFAMRLCRPFTAKTNCRYIWENVSAIGFVVYSFRRFVRRPVSQCNNFYKQAAPPGQKMVPVIQIVILHNPISFYFEDRKSVKELNISCRQE